MGSPVSVTVADLVMEDVEQRALSTFPNPPQFWKRYVDDTCTALKSDQVEAFHLHINSIEPTIQLTLELETDGCLPFLDTQISRHQDGSSSTKVYRKKTHTDKYLNFQSHHPLAHKLAVVRTLFHRADTLCSSVEDQDHEKKHVIRALSINGYPSGVMLRSETGKDIQAHSGGDPPRATVVLPYVRNTSESIRRVLSTVNIRTCFKPHRTLSQVLVHTKNPVPRSAGKLLFIGFHAALVICPMLVKLYGHCNTGLKNTEGH